jgi:glutamate carboxypeptidase
MIESGSANLAGISKVADFAEAQLKALGARTERIKAADSERVMVKGVLTGTGKLTALLIAHMDTVYADGILATEPYRQDGNRLYGPGIADDKGGIAVVLHSLGLLKEVDWRDYATITVLFNADEEIGSGSSGEMLAALGAAHDVVLSYEPSPAKSIAQVEAVLLGAAGTATASLEVKGRASHAGAAPEQGRNALIELSHQMLATQDIAKDIPGAQLNWTYAQGGLVRNQIPERAHAFADVRLLQPGAAEKLRVALESKVKESKRVPDTEVTVKFNLGRPPYLAGERGLALAKRAQAIYAELDGRKLQFIPTTGGGTDAGFAGSSGKPAVLESLGLAGWGYHAKNEYIEIDSIVPRIYLTSRLLQDLARNPVK